ncbi:uncharacterized protein LOC134446951 [Engraulis encrasicolus]|uniref:uncharacterized protein LOC134446951 n=1 Tax=Engraulis encrasicolus TaxID=184585 RepID=UPI002FD2A212
MEGLSELREMAAHQQGQLDVLSRWLGISQQPQPQPESQEASFTWESQHLGHPVRDRDGQRASVGAQRQPSPTAHSGGNGQASNRRLSFSGQESNRPRRTSMSHEASFTWGSQHLGHPVRDRDGQRASVGAQWQPSPTAHSGGNGQRASVGAQRQPSPTAHSGGNGQASNRRLSCSGLESNRPRRTSMSIQPGVTPSWIIMQCLCMIMCMCTLLMVNVLGGF